MEKQNLIAVFVALSGWATLFYNFYTNKPKIKGQILNLMTSEWDNPQFQKPKRAIFLYIYLINVRKNPVNILDYELEIDLGNGYERVIRVYGAQNMEQPTFKSNEHEIKIPNLNEKIIYKKDSLLTYGLPLHGFALFATDRSQKELEKIIKLKLTCIDAFNNRHIIKSSPKQFSNIIFLQDLAGIKIKDKNKQ
ncbi:hypothetical protein JXQ31_10105 [candidate division KSB1 bacterium]|nr:hypothetical protein [candidate division KSB1 bacterium]